MQAAPQGANQSIEPSDEQPIKPLARRKKVHDFKNADGPVWDEKLKRWLVRLSWYEYNAHGVRGRKDLKREFRRRRDAIRFHEQTEKDIVLGIHSNQRFAKKLLLGDALDSYRDSVRHLKSFESTINPGLRRWEKIFGRDTRVVELTRSRIAEARLNLIDGTPQGSWSPKGPIKKSTCDHYLRVLKTAFNFLHRENPVLSNPIEGIRYFNVDNRRLLWLHPDQFFAVLAACQGEEWWVGPAFEIAVCTGLRKFNVLNLEWPEVRFELRQIQIPGAKMKHGKTLTIPMCDRAYNRLRELYDSRSERGETKYVFPDTRPLAKRAPKYSSTFKRDAVQRVLGGEKQSEVARALGIGDDILSYWKKRVVNLGYDCLNDPPFNPMRGRPISERVLDRVWARIREKSGIADQFRESNDDSFHWHDNRHTFASWQAIKNTNIFRLKELMGHKTIKSTERYVYLSQLADHPDLGRKINDIFSDRGPDGGASQNLPNSSNH
jgi:integrase